MTIMDKHRFKRCLLVIAVVDLIIINCLLLFLGIKYSDRVICKFESLVRSVSAIISLQKEYDKSNLGNYNSKEVLCAYTALFSSQISNSPIPGLYLKKYQRVLGVKLSISNKISSAIISASSNYENIKKVLYEDIKETFIEAGRMDDLAFLDFIYHVKKGFVSNNISTKNYSVIAWNDFINCGQINKVSYTFGLSECTVYIFSIDDDNYYIMCHYDKYHIMGKEKFLNVIKNSIVKLQPRNIKVYIISSFFDESVFLIKNILNDLVCKKTYYLHRKPNYLVYNIKVVDGSVSYTENSILQNYGFYKSGLYMMPRTEYKKLSFIEGD